MTSGMYDFLVGIVLGLVTAWALLRAKFHKKLRYLQNAKAMAIMTEVAASAEMLKKVLGFTPSWVAYPEWEKARFVNGIIAELWPYVDKWCQRDLVKILESTFAYYKPDFITAIKIPKFELGKVPAMVTGMKCFPTPVEEIILEMDIKFIGDPQVTMEIFKGPVSVSTGFTDVQFFARVRVVLKPMTDRVPWFSALSLAFMEPPEMKYDLTGSGNMIEVIPGFNKIVDDLIRKMLKWVMVWPFRVIVPILERTDVQRKVGEKEEEWYARKWDYSFLAPRVQGVVEVNVLAAYDVVDMDVGGGADVSVKLTLTGTSGPMSFKTKQVKTQKGACVINEMHSFNVVEPYSQTIRAKLVDIDFGSDDKIGVGEIPIKRAGQNPYTPMEQVVDVKKDDKVTGRLKVILTYRPLLKQHGAEGAEHTMSPQGRSQAAPQGGASIHAPNGPSSSQSQAPSREPSRTSLAAPPSAPAGAPAGYSLAGASPGLATPQGARRVFSAGSPAVAASGPGGASWGKMEGEKAKAVAGSSTEGRPPAASAVVAHSGPSVSGLGPMPASSSPYASPRDYSGGMIYCKVLRAVIHSRRSKSLYVQASVDGVKTVRKTAIKRGHEAKWELDWEELDFTVVGSGEGKRMYIKLMGRDWLTLDDVMGSVSLPLDPVIRKGMYTETLRLQGGREGEMTLALRWLPY